jgi:PIN domain
VREIIETYAEQASFFVPEVAYAEAEEHVPALVIRRGGDPDNAVRFLRSLRGLVELIGSEVYGAILRARRANGWATGIRKIGRYWRQLWP